MSCESCEAKYRCPDAFYPHAIGCNNYNKNEIDNYDIEPYDIMFDMERTVNQILWEHIMGDLGFDWDNTYRNDVFVVKAYDWKDDKEDANDWHFWHKPSGFKLRWYKYPLRDVMCNMKITHEQFADILYDCHNSMEEGKSVKWLHEIDKWGKDMEIKDGKIVSATNMELYEYWLKSGWSDIYSYTEYKNKVKQLGTKVIEDDGN